ncbi:hypothetical protein DTO280E4_8602 [Paecilomyces variotii]|nr:hypothetical protein DTO169E5_4141 [Paecilomyces variotii]KAJ9350587.1 hypothetical protein DTO280E4_8602 [Paecilomyces variotii]KAJ9352556.1 hypothetical protein DTO027B9_5795 [Paecilomyces variotii]
MDLNDFQKVLKTFVEDDTDSAANLEAAFKEALSVARSRNGAEKDMFIHLPEWPESVKKPVLQAGQHRRAALSELLLEQSQAVAAHAKTPEGRTQRKHRGCLCAAAVPESASRVIAVGDIYGTFTLSYAGLIPISSLALY